MPAQTLASGAAYYFEGDTKPLIRTLKGNDGQPLDFTDLASATIRIGHATYDHYYSPHAVIVDDAPVTVYGDATNGQLKFDPGAGVMSPPGTFHYTYRLTWNDGTIETVPENTYEVLIIRARIGGAS